MALNNNNMKKLLTFVLILTSVQAYGQSTITTFKFQDDGELQPVGILAERLSLQTGTIAITTRLSDTTHNVFFEVLVTDTDSPYIKVVKGYRVTNDGCYDLKNNKVNNIINWLKLPDTK